MTDQTMTRRSAIRTGTLSALGVGMMGLAPTFAAAEQPAPAVSDLAPVRIVNYPDLTEHTRAAVAAYRAAVEAERAASDELEARFGHEAHLEIFNFIDGPFMAARNAWEDVLNAEIVRHLPMIAPIFELLWLHVLEEHADELGECCVDEADA